MIQENGTGQINAYRIIETFTPSRWGERFAAIYEPQRIKVLLWKPPAPLSHNDEAWRLLCAELGAWSRLEIDGVLPLLEWGISDYKPYFITSFPRGREVSALIADGLDRISALTILANLACVIEEARLRGILHLGIDPRDIWVREDLCVEVSGFGFWYVARDFPYIYPPDGPFSAPEQKEGLRVSSATDIYALALMYKALVLGDCQEKVESENEDSGLPDGYTPPFIFRCLDKNPASRFLTAGDFARHIFEYFPEVPYKSFDHDECPICRRQKEIRSRLDRNHFIHCSNQKYFAVLKNERIIMLLIVILFIATIIVWYLALK